MPFRLWSEPRRGISPPRRTSPTWTDPAHQNVSLSRSPSFHIKERGERFRRDLAQQQAAARPSASELAHDVYEIELQDYFPIDREITLQSLSRTGRARLRAIQRYEPRTWQVMNFAFLAQVVNLGLPNVRSHDSDVRSYACTSTDDREAKAPLEQR